MKKSPDELHDFDAQLMLYLAGELSSADTRELERALEQDEALRVRLGGLRALSEFCEAHLSAADAAEPLEAGRVARSAHRATRAIQAWAEADAVAGRITPEPSALENAVWRYARWPLTAAAVLVVGIIIWTFASDPNQRLGPTTEVTENDSWQRGRDRGDEDRAGRSGRFDASSGMGILGRGFGQEPGLGWEPDPTPDQVAAMFANPAGRWDTDGDANLVQLDLGSGFMDDLAAVQMLAGDLSADESESIDAFWFDSGSGM